MPSTEVVALNVMLAINYCFLLKSNIHISPAIACISLANSKESYGLQPAEHNLMHFVSRSVQIPFDSTNCSYHYLTDCI